MLVVDVIAALVLRRTYWKDWGLEVGLRGLDLRDARCGLRARRRGVVGGGGRGGRGGRL